MNEFAEILNLFIVNVIAYTFLYPAIIDEDTYQKHKKNVSAEPQHSDEITIKHK